MTSVNPQESQNATLPDETQQTGCNRSPKFDRAIVTSIKIQIALFILTALMLDMGQMSRACLVAMLCHWSVIILIRLRRPLAPTEVDLRIVRYGIIPLFLVIYNLGPALLHRLGIPKGLGPDFLRLIGMNHG